MNNEVSIVKMYACSRQTRSSMPLMNRANGTVRTAPTHAFCRMNTMLISDRMTTCPAVMLANNRTHSANGLVNIPRISTGIMIGISQTGRPWHQVPEMGDDTVRAHPRDLDHQEGHPRERRGHADVPRGSRHVREEPQQVAEENEDERAEKVRHEAVPVVADVLARQLVPHE